MRLIAADVLVQVADQGRSLTTVLPPALRRVADADQGLLQECCYGGLRWYSRLDYLLNRLLEKPLKRRERKLRALLLLGLYQLIYLRIPAYAAVSETVASAHKLDKSWAPGLVNGVLRNFQRRRTALLAELTQDAALDCAHPAWLLEHFQQDWPTDWQALVSANNAYPPQHLRVNLRQISRADYLQRLCSAAIAAHASEHTETGITLASPLAVERLPGFAAGLASVQDTAAQLAAGLLQLQPGQHVLDACAAPGGKTCHILEYQPAIDLVALDNDPERLQRLRDNLNRLHLTADATIGNALKPATWWDGKLFDRILLDAPCSATGVIRRHPDIKLLRKASDLKALTARQQSLLECLWALLAPGGLLVYATCSVLRRENEDNIAAFLAHHQDAQEIPITAAWGQERPHGRQILPGDAGMDGFYYACISKTHNG